MVHLRPAKINRVARLIGARRYLEVGVCEGTTFLQVDIAEKVAVDPSSNSITARRRPQRWRSTS